jgi:hypothetical protein
LRRRRKAEGTRQEAEKDEFAFHILILV